MSYFTDVGDFHRKFGLPVAEDTAPNTLTDDMLAFRGKFLVEELVEFFEAAGLRRLANSIRHDTEVLLRPQFRDGTPDLEKMADAIGDLIYVALGTAHKMGVPFEAIWAEIQRANMTKVRADGETDPRSTRGHASDVVKPAGWTPPNHGPAIEYHRKKLT